MNKKVGRNYQIIIRISEIFENVEGKSKQLTRCVQDMFGTLMSGDKI